MDRYKIGIYFRTIKNLKLIQIYYRLFYFFRNKLFIKKYHYKNIKPNSNISWKNTINSFQSYYGNNTFEFLNKKKKFSKIDWNFSDYGKLWNYNLVYFDFLNQEDLELKESLNLIHNFIEKDDSHISGNEPYTISLRNINWIKFLLVNDIKDRDIDDYLFNSYKSLIDNLEYHLLGNHLLENAFSLIFGAYYFDNTDFYKKAKKILMKELDIQILNDGGHFELSPMYHSIILHRILDCIYLMDNNTIDSTDLYKKLRNKAILMLSWLESISYKNNEIPHFNDSVDGVALSPKELFIYANSIGIKWNKSILDESGYRKFSNEKYECIIDVGPLGPHYLLGHSHSDISNFEFRFKSIPFIVDTGTSTYENNKTRIIEKSTNSHNTIMVNDISQSEMWNSFRVGRIAKVTNLFEENNFVSVSHNGYSHINMQHCREFLFNDNSIMIKDKVKGPHLTNIKSSLHFHPDRKIKLLDNSVLIDDKVELKLINHIKLKVINYDYCEGFNKTKKAKKLISFVNNESLITINF